MSIRELLARAIREEIERRFSEEIRKYLEGGNDRRDRGPDEGTCKDVKEAAKKEALIIWGDKLLIDVALDKAKEKGIDVDNKVEAWYVEPNNCKRLLSVLNIKEHGAYYVKDFKVVEKIV